MSEAHHIRVLSSQVANKIAAGEVVDRPASVLKELLENAIDAGATQVDIETVAGGRKLIAVSDNGSGMNRDDALLSVERHATSKIRDVDDIERIATLGFRGEALAAISSVSRFVLKTATAESSLGSEVVITGGKLQDVREIGLPGGTAVEVRDLFFNVPARRKFLRSEETETAYLRQAFIPQALSHPALGLAFRADGRDVYRFAAAGSLEDRIRDIFGVALQRDLGPVDRAAAEVRVRGYVSLPSLHRADRSEQYVFVNGRAATSAAIGHAIREGYHTLIPVGRHPVVFLFLSLDPALVDVNVHPTKKEVRFRHPGEVRDAIIAAIREALVTKPAGAGQGKRPPVAGPAGAGPAPASEDRLLRIEDLPPTRSFKYPRLPMIPASPAERGASSSPPVSGSPEAAPAAPAGGAIPSGRQGEAAASADASESGARSPWAWCRVLGQIGPLYVILETEDGYVIMDPHAAHERVMFEKFMDAVAHRRVETQGLLMPESIDLMPKDALCVRRNLDLLREMGFGISEFGGDSFVVDAVPAPFAGVPVGQFLTEVANHFEQAGSRGLTTRWREEMVAQAACKAAVKARDRLSLAQIEQLVVDLASTAMPYTCPHGRPTLIYTSFKDLDKKFGRGG